MRLGKDANLPRYLKFSQCLHQNFPPMHNSLSFLHTRRIPLA